MSSIGLIRLVGLGMLLLGALSGGALFIRAVSSNKGTPDSSAGTLWGLFIIGLIVGIIIISSTGWY